jgi:predicted nucleic acid-binding Zn ribbon protein
MSDAISLGVALKRFLEKSRIKHDIQSLQIEDHWAKIMGVTIAKFTDKIEIRNGTLFIYTSVAPLKNELVFQKDLILQRVNESMGEQVVKEVVIA